MTANPPSSLTDVMSTVFVVTGSSSGVGRALALFLARHGVSVVGLDRREPPDREIAHVRCDLADPRSIDTAVDRLDDRVDALANVAGVPGTRTTPSRSKCTTPWKTPAHSPRRG